jgi:molecular chaperone GrpE
MSTQDNPADEQDQVIEQEPVEQTEAGTIKEVTVASLQLELQAALAQAQGHKDEVIRAQAEMQNIRRRAELDVAKAHNFGQEKLITELLGLVDNLERAISASKAEHTTLENLLEGVEMSQTMLLDGLKKFNVEQVDPHGEPFNPELHEAITVLSNPDMEPNTVMEVFQKGYTLNGRLIRPAMVVVAKEP